MPIKSKAQRRKFAELLMKGEISEEVFEEWNRGAGDKVLPERLHPKKGTKAKTKPKARRSRVAKAKSSTRKKATRKKATRKTRSRTRA